MSYQTTLVGLLEDSKEFQLLIDPIAETFEQPVWQNYLNDKFTLSLDWRAVLGVMENSPAASVIDFSSGKPLAVRPTVSKLNGEIPTMGNKYQMSKREVRDLLELQDNVGKLGISPTELINFLVPDMKRATLGPHKTIDRLFLEAISTGVMTSTASNNPKGVVWNSSLDWGIEQNTVSTVWSNAASATPVADIKTVVDAWIGKGVQFNIMKMSRATFNLMVATAEFKEAFGFEVKKSDKVVTVKSAKFLGVKDVNDLLESVDLPLIEIINAPVTIETKAGTYTTIRPFADNRVSFSVDNNYGDVLRTYANEQRIPNKVKTYATSMNVLLSKYSDMDGNEFTEGELSAFPVLNKANSIAILKTDVTA